MKKLCSLLLAFSLIFAVSITVFAKDNDKSSGKIRLGSSLGDSGTLGGSGSTYSRYSDSSDGTTKQDRNINGLKDDENRQKNGSARPPQAGNAHPNPDTGGARLYLPYAVALKD